MFIVIALEQAKKQGLNFITLARTVGQDNNVVGVDKDKTIDVLRDIMDTVGTLISRELKKSIRNQGFAKVLSP